MRYVKKKNTKTRKILLVVFAALLLMVLAGILLSVSGAAKISNLTSLVIDPIVRTFQNTVDWTNEGFESFSQNKSYIKENKELKEKIEELEAKSILLEIYREEINGYKGLLDLQKELIRFELISAKVVFTTIGNLQTGMTLNKGVSKGILVGMPVLSGDKLIGIVKDVDLISTRVRTIYEKDFVIIARNSRNHEILRVRGDSTAYFNELLICDYLPLRSQIQEGDMIETSVLGDKYPNSIKIGSVEKIDYDRDGKPIKAYIKPYIEPNNIDVVYILNYKELEE